MAQVVCQIMALGSEACGACGKPVPRGVVMKAVEYDDGETAGWLCPSCIDTWKRTGKPPALEGQ